MSRLKRRLIHIFGADPRCALRRVRPGTGVLGLGVLLPALLVGCGWVGSDTSSDAGAPGAGREPPGLAARVVSLTPSATRFVLAIGAGERLVAVDAASAALSGLESVPVTDAAGARAWAPDLVLAPPDSPLLTLPGAQLDLGGARVRAFEPHDLEDAFELCREVGALLVGPAEASRFEAAIARPLAALGGASFGRPRPRVLALVGLDPPIAAGGHSFETDLVEIAGGRSVTHGGADPRRPATAETVARLAPDGIVVMTRATPGREALERARDALGVAVPVDAIAVDVDTLWSGGLLPIAQSLAPVVERLAAGGPAAPRSPATRDDAGLSASDDAR